MELDFVNHNLHDRYVLWLKLTNAVGKVGHIFCRTIDFIDQKGYRSENLKDWLLPVLIVATYVGMEFAQEIDLDDDSEMEAYLNS